MCTRITEIVVAETYERTPMTGWGLWSPRQATLQESINGAGVDEKGLWRIIDKNGLSNDNAVLIGRQFSLRFSLWFCLQFSLQFFLINRQLTNSPLFRSQSQKVAWIAVVVACRNSYFCPTRLERRIVPIIGYIAVDSTRSGLYFSISTGTRAPVPHACIHPVILLTPNSIRLRSAGR